MRLATIICSLLIFLSAAAFAEDHPAFCTDANGVRYLWDSPQCAQARAEWAKEHTPGAASASPTPTAPGSGAVAPTLVLDDGTKVIAQPECSDGDLCGVVQFKSEQHREDFVYDRVEIYNHFSQAVGPVCGQYNLEFRYLWHGKTQATHDELEPVIRRMTSPWSTTCAFLGRPFTLDKGKIYTTATQNRNGSLSLSFTAR